MQSEPDKAPSNGIFSVASVAVILMHKRELGRYVQRLHEESCLQRISHSVYELTFLTGVTDLLKYAAFGSRQPADSTNAGHAALSSLVIDLRLNCGADTRNVLH